MPDSKAEVFRLLKLHGCKLDRISSQGHSIYILPSRQKFTIASDHGAGSDPRKWRNNLAGLRSLLGIGLRGSSAKIGSRKLRTPRPKPITRTIELDIPAPRTEPLAAPPGPSPERIMAPRVNPDTAKQPTDAGTYAHIDLSLGSNPQPIGSGAVHHRPSERSSQGRSLPPEVIEAANRELQRTGSAEGVLRTPTTDLMAMLTDTPLDVAAVAHRQTPNILDMRAQYERLHKNVDPTSFIVNALMYLVNHAHDTRANFLAASEQSVNRPAPILTPTAVPRRRTISMTPKALRYRRFIAEYCRINKCKTGEAGQYWSLMSEEEKNQYLPKVEPAVDTTEGVIVESRLN